MKERQPSMRVWIAIALMLAPLAAVIYVLYSTWNSNNVPVNMALDFIVSLALGASLLGLLFYISQRPWRRGDGTE
jgi:hypothetical protein